MKNPAEAGRESGLFSFPPPIVVAAGGCHHSWPSERKPAPYAPVRRDCTAWF